MEDLMPDLIERLDRWLRQNRPGYYSQLLPGLTDEQIMEFEEALGISLPPDFKLLYKWKNGQPSGHYDSFIFNL
ncbi:MAG TPA: SMI1/KNR4 family protein, partial [Chroococcales cyanobacterium]